METMKLSDGGIHTIAMPLVTLNAYLKTPSNELRNETQSLLPHVDSDRLSLLFLVFTRFRCFMTLVSQASNCLHRTVEMLSLLALAL
jgi:hypothetical protein